MMTSGCAAYLRVRDNVFSTVEVVLQIRKSRGQSRVSALAPLREIGPGASGVGIGVEGKCWSARRARLNYSHAAGPKAAALANVYGGMFLSGAGLSGHCIAAHSVGNCVEIWLACSGANVELRRSTQSPRMAVQR